MRQGQKQKNPGLFPGLKFRARWFALFLTLATLPFACVSFVDLPPRAKGGVENPVLCDSPECQRNYLRRLRPPQKRGNEKRSDESRLAKNRVDENFLYYEYSDVILGPKGKLLDRFIINNPLDGSSEDPRGPWDVFMDLFRDTPLVPPAFRIYMDMYNPGVMDTKPVKGFRLIELKDALEKPGKSQPGGGKSQTEDNETDDGTKK